MSPLFLFRFIAPPLAGTTSSAFRPRPALAIKLSPGPQVSTMQMITTRFRKPDPSVGHGYITIILIDIIALRLIQVYRGKSQLEAHHHII